MHVICESKGPGPYGCVSYIVGILYAFKLFIIGQCLNIV